MIKHKELMIYLGDGECSQHLENSLNELAIKLIIDICMDARSKKKRVTLTGDDIFNSAVFLFADLSSQMQTNILALKHRGRQITRGSR